MEDQNNPEENKNENQIIEPSVGSGADQQLAGSDPVAPTPPSQPESSTNEPEPGAGVVLGAKQPTKKGKSKLAVLLVLALLLIAGGGAAYYFFSIRPTEPATSTVPVNRDVESIKFGIPEGPANQFYPHTTTFAEPININQQIFEGLVRFKDINKITPLLAESWSNPDNNTWVFKLKRGVTFHTGREMKASHVEQSIKQVMADPESQDFNNIYTSTIKSVEATDDYTVKITTKSPDPILLNRLTSVMVFDTESDKKKSPVNGTGPYTLDSSSEPTEKNVKLVAYDNYHGGHVYTRKLEFVVYELSEDTTTGQLADRMLEDLKSGKINIVSFPNGNDSSGKAVSQLGDRAVIAESAVTFLEFNNQKGNFPTKNTKARQALVYALDKTALLKDSERDLTSEPADQLLTKDIPGYNPDIKPPEKDLAKAKQLLKEAGYPNGYTISAVVTSGYIPVVEALDKQLKEIGVRVKTQVENDDTVFFDKLEKGEYQSWNMGYAADLIDAEGLFTSMFQTSYYSNDEANKLIEQIKSNINQAERLKHMQQVSKILVDDVAAIPLWSTKFVTGMDKKYDFNRDVLNGSFGVYFWQLKSPL